MKTWVVDTETDDINFTQVWCTVFRNVDTDKVEIFRNFDKQEKSRLWQFVTDYVDTLVGHNIQNFDMKVLRFLGVELDNVKVIDTLVISRLLNFTIEGGHSLEAWGERFKVKKSLFSNYSVWSQELENRCVTDTEINVLLYKKFQKYLESPNWKLAIENEHLTNHVCNTMSTKGITFDYTKGILLYNSLSFLVKELRESFNKEFPKKSTLVREVLPKNTSKGALSTSNLRFAKNDEGIIDLRVFTSGHPFSLFTWTEFNPDSPKQRVDRLNKAGWHPVNKTKGYMNALRDRSTPKEKLDNYKIYGWTTDEENLATLPHDAPESIKKLKQYLVLSSRLGDVKEWLDLVEEQSGLPKYHETPESFSRPPRMEGNTHPRLHPSFMSIGSWTHRVSHQKPNMANIPALHDKQGNIQLFGGECRELFTVPEGYKMVGVDAEGIQLRVFAHLCEDKRLIEAIEKGRKEDESDIHTLNKNLLGPICASRDTAKTFIYALLLGAGVGKLSSILKCSTHETQEGIKRILDFYPGWKKLIYGRLKEEGEKGWIRCLDGRALMLPEPRLALTGHLQSGEKIIMQEAMKEWIDALKPFKKDYQLVNWVHDEWQTEVKDVRVNDCFLPELIAKRQILGIQQAGESLNMNIRLTGNRKIGNNWKETH